MNLRGEPRELSYAELRISPTFPEQENVISVQTIGAGRNTEWNARSLETVNETKVGKVGWIDEFCPSARGLIVREQRNYFHTWSKQMAGTRVESVDPRKSIPRFLFRRFEGLLTGEIGEESFPDLTRDFLRNSNSDRESRRI